MTSVPEPCRVGTYIKLNSGGYLVHTGDAFPAWRHDMGAVRRLLLELDLASAIRRDHLAISP